MICFDLLLKNMSWRRLLCRILIVSAVVGLAACGSKDKKTNQTLVRVNGEDITVLQLNDELKRANVQEGKQDAASKQLLESLIDRQLVVEEAQRDKLDRSPQVVLAIERAKAQIIAQAYLQSVTSKVAKPTRAEMDDYYQKHPEFFSKRKQFIMNQLIVPEKNFNDDLKLFIHNAKTQQEVADWLDQHGVQYSRGQAIRSTMDLPAEAVPELMAMPKGQLFLVTEGDNKVLNEIVAIKDSPVTEENAAPLIEQFLTNEKMKDVANTEITHLRLQAKIEYVNAPEPVAGQTGVAEPDNKSTGPK